MHQVDHLTEYSVPAHTINSTPNNYVISLANLSSHFAAAESAPSNIISIYDKSTLQRLQTLPGHEISTTSLHSMSETLVSSGKDGTVRVWDGRSKKPSLTLKDSTHTLGILCCDVSSDGISVVAGTEMEGDDAFLLYWDTRQPAVPIRVHSATHSDDITAVKFAPRTDSNIVLSASADGLLSTSNTEENDEDEAVLYVGNWGCSVSQLGWINSPDPCIWAASDMETFSTWSEELDQRSSLDIRSPSVHTQTRTWVTDYLISCMSVDSDPNLRVFVGSNEGDVALISNPSLSDPGDSWCLHMLWTHSHTEIVRSMIWDEQNSILVTGGEDSRINIWPSAAAGNFTDVDMQ